MALPFRLRQHLKWPGLRYREPSAQNGFVPPTDRGKELFKKYELDRVSSRLSRQTWDELLGTLDLLDRADLGRAFPSSLSRVVDVGAKNWRYAGALSAWLAHVCRGDSQDASATIEARESAGPVQVTGVELDAYRLYSDLTT